MIVRYIGQSFGEGNGLTNGKVYECTEVDELTGALRIIDDEGPAYWSKKEDGKDGYLYSPVRPCPAYDNSLKGKWEIVEDDANGTLAKTIII